jgi:hypothetical protein
VWYDAFMMKTGDNNMDRVNIQLQDNSGNWRTYTNTYNNSQMIVQEMTNLSRNNPNKRVRAVDTSGRVVDIL